jgi:hypothetical protein
MEGLPLAQTVKESLSDHSEADLWKDESVFPIGEVALRTLEEHATRYDFAVIVMTPDDIGESRNSVSAIARDNLVFELGLFMGGIGAKRTLIICSDRDGMRLPSNLNGLDIAFYHEAMVDSDVKKAVATACGQVRERLRVLGISEGRRAPQLADAVKRLTRLGKATRETLKRHDASQSKPVRFEKITDAEGPMLAHMESFARKQGGIEFDWLGMTMYNVWNTLPSLLTKVAGLQPPPPYLSLRVAMLSKSWLKENRINSAWTARSAEQQHSAIKRFFKEKQKQGFTTWTVKIRRYSHMPAVHGGLINGEVLVSGICRWDNGDLWAGDRPYEMHVEGDANNGTDRIKVFKGWFDVCWQSGGDPSLLKWKTT